MGATSFSGLILDALVPFSFARSLHRVWLRPALRNLLLERCQSHMVALEEIFRMGPDTPGSLDKSRKCPWWVFIAKIYRHCGIASIG
jgi:hypothetical protein